MVDETNRAGEAPTGTIAGTTAGEFSSLESYIATNGPINWRECLALFHDVCFRMETEPGCTGAMGELTIHSFVVRKAYKTDKPHSTDTTNGITIEISPQNDPESSKAVERLFPSEAYMSPEKCLDRPVNRRSDIYSLGCVIYHSLTGAPPFMHRDTEKLKEMQTIDYALPPGRRSQRRVIPDEVDTMIDSCLEKDPAKRLKNAGLLRANIGRVLQLEDLDQADEPSPQSKHFADFSRRKRNSFISVAILVAVTAGIGAASLNITSSTDFTKLVQRTVDRQKNKFFLQLEHGAQFTAQAEFENGKMIPDSDKEPIEIKVKDEDLIIFATTKRATIKDALEEAVRRRLIIYKADLIGQNLQGAKIPAANLEHSFLIETNLDGADLRHANLKEAIFAGSSMKGANLSGANSPEAVFQACNLEGANLSSAVLFDSDFSKANLKNADLSNSTLSNSSFAGADLTGANLKGAALGKAGLKTANLTEQQKSEIRIIEGPKLNSKQLEQSAKGLNLVKPGLPSVNFRDQNPFSNPLEGTSAFGRSQNEPIGMNIDLKHLPPAPPRKSRAPQPPPLEQALPGHKIELPSNPKP